MSPISLLIADDHRIFAEGLESVLNQTGLVNVRAIAGDGNQLLAMMEQEQPDVVLLDISMPEMDGFKTAAVMKERFPAVKIVVLTMHNAEEHIIPMVKLGVHGYILKNSGKTEVLSAIRSVYESGQYFSPEISYKISAHKKAPERNTVRLSDREKQVLQLVFDGLSTNRISEKLFISPRTVETHRKNLLNKTGSENTAQLIHFALVNNLIENFPHRATGV